MFARCQINNESYFYWIMINATLFGLPDSQLVRLQHMFHITARILTLTLQINHITPVLKELHWLPIKTRINYKIILLTFKARHGLAPQYVVDLQGRVLSEHLTCKETYQ